MHSPDPDDTCECGETTLLGCIERPARKCPAMNGRYRMEKPRMLDITSIEGPKLKVQKLTPDAIVPTRSDDGAIGYDLYAVTDQQIDGGERALVKTNIAVAIPEGHYGRVAPRSGLAYKHGIDVFAGVIDPNYRGNLGVVLFNSGFEVFKISAGDRVAQLVLERASVMPVEEVDSLGETSRGEGAYGSTGR